MIRFSGTVKDFFKKYPKEDRKVGETYQIITTKGSHDYQFIGSTSEKSFKRVEGKDSAVKKVTRKSVDKDLQELKDMANSLKINNDDSELSCFISWINHAKTMEDILNENFIAQFNVLYRFDYFVSCHEAQWEAPRKESRKISDFICNVSQILSHRCRGTELFKYIINDDSVEDFANLFDEYDACGHFLSNPDCAEVEFNLKNIAFLKKLSQKFDKLIRDGYLSELDSVVEDYAKFGEIFGDKTFERYGWTSQPVRDLFRYFTQALSALYIKYTEQSK